MSFSSVPEKCEKTLTGHKGAISSVVYNDKCEYCVSGASDRKVILWNPIRGNIVCTYSAHGNTVNDVKISQIASCGSDRNVFIYDTLKGESIRKLYGHSQVVNCISYNDDCTVLASGSYDKTLRLWDLKTYKVTSLQIIDDYEDSVSACAIKGNLIVSGCVDGAVRIHDVRKGALKEIRFKQPVSHVDLTYDSKCALVSTLDNRIRLIDVNSRKVEVLNCYKGHKNTQFRLKTCFSSDVKNIICGSEDGVICIWDFVNANLKRKLHGHQQAVTCVAYHKEKTRMISGSNDGTIRVWTGVSE